MIIIFGGGEMIGGNVDIVIKCKCRTHIVTTYRVSIIVHPHKYQNLVLRIFPFKHLDIF